MLMTSLIVLTTALTLTDVPSKEKAKPAAAGPDTAELKKLQGKWIVTRMENGGKASDPKQLASLSVEVTDAKMVVRDGQEVKEQVVFTALSAKPKVAEMDLKVTTPGAEEGKVIKGIYKVANGELTFCFAEPGKDRPKAFETALGSGHTLLVCKKAAK